MITTENLAYSYFYDENSEDVEKKVLKNLNIQIKKGSFVAILGHNGCGKSTLAKHFNAILLPVSGTVYIDKMDTKKEEFLFEIRKKAGMVFQNPDNQIVTAIVEDEVAFAPENLGIEPLMIRKRVDEAISAVGMDEFKLAQTAGLSGGQKQRIAIASILAMEPECIILDEPTAMLDPKGRKEVLKTIKKLNKEKNITVILITHYMDEAIEADKILVMEDGMVIMEDTPKKVFKRAEELKALGLDVPQVTELTHMLIDEGYDLPSDIIDIDECAQELIKYLQKEEE